MTDSTAAAAPVAVTVAPATTLSKVEAWLRQSTTGQGGAMLSATLIGYLMHTLTPAEAAIGLVGGLFLIAFPQKTASVGVVQAVATDVEKVGMAFLAGHTAGQTLGTAAATALKSAPSLLSDAGDLVAALKENTTATMLSAGAQTAATVTQQPQVSIPVAVIGDAVAAAVEKAAQTPAAAAAPAAPAS